MRAAAIIGLLSAAPGMTSCSLLPTGCAGVGAYGLEISVVDGLTNAPAATGATLLTHDLEHGGVRIDSVIGRNDEDILRGADDRDGRYSVFVRKSGYRDWSKADVTVHDGCPAIEPVRFTARLARPSVQVDA